MMTPLTIETMIAVHASVLGPERVQAVFGAYNPYPYFLLYLSLRIETAEQLRAAMEDPDAVAKLTRIYSDHLGREPDGIAMCSHLPTLATCEAGEACIEGGVVRSSEHVKRKFRAQVAALQAAEAIKEPITEPIQEISK